jgi:hypothetical protein
MSFFSSGCDSESIKNLCVNKNLKLPNINHLCSSNTCLDPGSIGYDPSTKEIYVFNGSNWVIITSNPEIIGQLFLAAIMDDPLSVESETATTLSGFTISENSTDINSDTNFNLVTGIYNNPANGVSMIIDYTVSVIWQGSALNSNLGFRTLRARLILESGTNTIREQTIEPASSNFMNTSNIIRLVAIVQPGQQVYFDVFQNSGFTLTINNAFDTYINGYSKVYQP